MADIIPSSTRGTLRVEIQYDTPIAASDFADFISGLANEFRRFAAAKLPEGQRPELYIERIERGSIIVELVAAAGGALLVANNVNTILDFVDHLKTAFDKLLGKSDRKGMTKTQIKNISNIVKPISKGQSTQLIVGTVNINVDNIVISNEQAQQILSSTTTDGSEALRTLVAPVDVKMLQDVFTTTDAKKVNLVFTKIEKSGGDYFCEGVIEELSKKPATISFKTPAIESEMLRPQGVNPLENTYTVDVRIITNRKRTVGYEVVNLHRAISN